MYASRWPLGGEVVWTIVNRNEYDVAGDQIEVAAKGDLRYFDLYHGVELKPQTRPAGRTVLAFSIEAKGYGAVLATNSAPDQKAVALMSKMKELTARPLADYSHEWKVLPQQIVPIQATNATSSAPARTVKVPEADFLFKVSGIEIEGFNDIGVDVQYPWEDTPRRFHEHPMHVTSFYIDRYPVCLLYTSQPATRSLLSRRIPDGQFHCHQLALCGNASRLPLPPPLPQMTIQRAEAQTATLAKLAPPHPAAHKL